MSVKPVIKEEIITDIINNIPDGYIDVFNELIKKKINSINKSFEITISEIIEACRKKELYDYSIYENGIIMLFEKQGWKIDKTTYSNSLFFK